MYLSRPYNLLAYTVNERDGSKLKEMFLMETLSQD